MTLPPEFDRVLRDYEREWSARSPAGLARLFTEDGFVLQTGQAPVRGREAIARAYTGSGGPLALRALAYATADTVGYIIGGYTSTAGAPDIGKFILLLRRERNGPWRIAADMDNGNQPRGAGPAGPPGARLDHIILHTGSLSQGSADFARVTGVMPVVGGEHPGRGTRNALVSLGGSYLELLAPILDSGPAAPLVPVGWAVRTDDVAQLAARLKEIGVALSVPIPGSRRKPDGEVLTWRTAGVVGANASSIPFFIEWGKETRHPSATSPSGCSLETFTLTGPDAGALRPLVELLRLPVTVRPGTAAAASLTLRCPKGLVTFSR